MARPPNPLVTIGIPTYNRANKTLPAALKSALDQTYNKLQIVVSDNCSSDNTEQLVTSFNDNRIDYIRHAHNIGANNNFNACVEHAKGEYFLLLHDDDIVDEDFVQCCIDALGDVEKIGLIRTGIRMIDAQNASQLEWPNSLEGESFADLIRGWCANETTMFCCNTLINTAALRSIGCFHSQFDLFQDVLAHVKIAASFGFINVEPVKASFRNHDENRGSAARISDWCEDSLELLEAIRSLADEQDKEELYLLAAVFLCRINYSYIVEVRSPLKKFQLYRKVQASFSAVSPMWSYYYSYDLQPAWRSLKQTIKLKLGIRK